MKKSKFKKIKNNIEWFDDPEDSNYPAALSYLSLIYQPSVAGLIVENLKKAEMSSFKAKDIFRASRLPLLGISNFQIKKNLKKIKNGEKISPLLLVRDKVTNRLIIADGYHRISAIYSLDEDISVPCKII